MLPVLERLGVDLAGRKPARIERLRLRFPRFEKNASLPECAYGLSRYAFDELLIGRARALGTELTREAVDQSARPLVTANGRRQASTKGDRLFGFKAHFRGPTSDAIELHFLERGYVGINSVEDGITNVCGLASEAVLRDMNFEYDEYLWTSPALRERLKPLTRVMEWMSVGPLIFGTRFREGAVEGVYPAGDALSFVDPFTGTGMAGAVITGRLAGEFAAGAGAAIQYLAECRKVLSSPFLAASIFRMTLQTRAADFAAAMIPVNWLVRLTRPRCQPGR